MLTGNFFCDNSLYKLFRSVRLMPEGGRGYGLCGEDDDVRTAKKVVTVVTDPAARIPRRLTIIEEIEAKESAFSLKELARLTGVSYTGLFDMVTAGRLPVMRVGTRIRCDPQTTADWLRQRKTA